MKFKNLWVICPLIILSQTLSGQPLTKIQREFFVLGTLDDYMGRRLNPDEKNLLDTYYSYEASLVTILDSLLKIDYSGSDYKAERYFESNGSLSSSQILSDAISRKFNAYYKFVPSGSLTTLESDTIYEGALKYGIFKTDEEKLAFLAGVYVRFGRHNDTAYQISMANSISKASVCYNLLSEFDSKPSYVIMKNYIPWGYHVYFHPQGKLKEFLQQYMYVRKRLEASEKKIYSDYEESKKNKN